jgi:hypothetical protein
MLMVVSVLILYHDDDARTYIQACSNSVISFQHSLAFLARQVDKALTGAVSLFSNSTTQRGQTASALCCQDPSQSLLCPLFRTDQSRLIDGTRFWDSPLWPESSAL